MYINLLHILKWSKSFMIRPSKTIKWFLDDFKKDNLENLFIVNLEDLTNDPTTVSKNIYKFLNLDWSKKCLEINNEKLIIKTASNLQARHEIKKHNLDYIQSYSKILKELGFKNKLLT